MTLAQVERFVPTFLRTEVHMIRLARFSALLTGVLLYVPALLSAHGGQYRGPGDTVPPGGTGSGPGGVAGGPTGPSGPGGSTPVTGGPRGQGPGGSGAGPSVAFTPGGDPSLDLTQWTFWWEFNKDPYLDLKRRLADPGAVTGSDGWFLGIGEKSQTLDSMAPTSEQIRSTVVPALLAALEQESNNDIVTGCLIALAKIGDAPAESQASPFGVRIAHFLADKNQEISETAAVALGILGNPAAIEPLRDLLADSPRGRTLVGRHEVPLRTRAFAAYGLGQIGARGPHEEQRRAIVQALHAELEQRAETGRDLPVACLIAIGLTPLETLEAPAGSAPELARTAQIDYLLAFLADATRPSLVRAHVPIALARLLTSDLGDDLWAAQRARIVETLLPHAAERSKESAEIVQSALVALGMLATNDAASPLDLRVLETLAERVREGEPQARRFALMALAQAGARNAPAGRDSEAGLELVTRALLRALAEGKGDLPSWAALACGVLGRELALTHRATQHLANLQAAVRLALKETRASERIGALALAAGLLNDLEASAELRRRLATQKDDGARGYVAVGLGLMSAREATEEIQAVVADSKYRPDLLKQAAIALGLLGDKRAAELLAERLATAQGLATQASLSSALGFIGDRRSLDPLVAMLRNETLSQRARGFAAVALGIVGDRSELPWNSVISRGLNYRASTSTLTDPGSGTGILDLL